jgi:hypothetical protein
LKLRPVGDDLAVTRNRYLHFDNIDLSYGRAITACCSACGRQFVGKPIGTERTDDVVLRVRVEFDAHKCEPAHLNTSIPGELIDLALLAQGGSVELVDLIIVQITWRALGERAGSELMELAPDGFLIRGLFLCAPPGGVNKSTYHIRRRGELGNSRQLRRRRWCISLPTDPAPPSHSLVTGRTSE